MIGLVRDTWRAVLVVVVVTLLRPPAPPPPAPPQPVWHPAAPQAIYMPPPPQEPARPLQRIGRAFLELGDSVISTIR